MSEKEGILSIVAEHSNQDAAERLERALYDYNAEASGMSEWKPLQFCVRDATGALEGGLSGYLWGGVLHVAIVWLSERARGQGLGSSLLQAAEAYAVEHNHFDAYLSTFDFQAPEFYRKLGYSCFGELANCPRGHTYYFMHKRLPPSAAQPPKADCTPQKDRGCRTR